MAGFTVPDVLKAASLMLVLYLSICSPPANGRRFDIVCFYNNSAQHRPGVGSFDVSDVDPSLCTHLVFGFAQLDGNKVIATEDNDDLPDGMWRQFNDLKQANSSLKTLLSVGGPSSDTARFVTMASVPANRAEFIFELIFLLREWNFDGVHIEWEHPGIAEKDLFTSLLQEMNSTFAREAAIYNLPKLLLAISVPAFNETIEAGYDIPALDGSVDMYFVKAFDYHGPWENVTGPISDFDDAQENLNNYLTRQATSEKLHLTIPLYGRSYTLENPANNKVFDPAVGPGLPLNYTQEPGLLAFYELCILYSDGAQQVSRDRNIITYGDQWITLSALFELNNQQEYYNYFDSSNFGGVVLWTLDYDDFTGTICGGDPYPLVNIVFNTFLEKTTTTSETTTATTTSTTTTSEATTTTTTPTTTTSEATTTTTTPTTTTSEATTTTTTPTTTTSEATTTTTTPTTSTSETTTTTTTPTTTTSETTTPTTTTSETTTTTTTPTTTTSEATTTTTTPTTTTSEATTTTTTPTTTTSEATITTTTPTMTTSEATTTTTTPTTTTSEAATTTTTLQRGPFLECPTQYGNYPHRESCEKYIICLGMPFIAQCSANKIFNPDSRICEDSATSSYTCDL